MLFNLLFTFSIAAVALTKQALCRRLCFCMFDLFRDHELRVSEQKLKVIK